MKLRLLIVGAALTATTAASLAQDYPARPIRLILGFAPGGSTDLVARVVGQKMAEAWAQQVVVDNRPGANGMIGADLVAKANPDGYSLLLSQHRADGDQREPLQDAVRTSSPILRRSVTRAT